MEIWLSDLCCDIDFTVFAAGLLSSTRSARPEANPSAASSRGEIPRGEVAPWFTGDESRFLILVWFAVGFFCCFFGFWGLKKGGDWSENDVSVFSVFFCKAFGVPLAAFSLHEELEPSCQARKDDVKTEMLKARQVVLAFWLVHFLFVLWLYVFFLFPPWFCFLTKNAESKGYLVLQGRCSPLGMDRPAVQKPWTPTASRRCLSPVLVKNHLEY